MADAAAIAGMFGLSPNASDDEVREHVAAFRELIEDEDALWIDGEKATWDLLTFREQRQIRQLAYEPEPAGFGLDKDTDFDELPLMDIYPLMVLVFRRRSNPEYALDDALNVKRADLRAPATPKNGSRRRPTKKG